MRTLIENLIENHAASTFTINENASPKMREPVPSKCNEQTKYGQVSLETNSIGNIAVEENQKSMIKI